MPLVRMCPSSSSRLGVWTFESQKTFLTCQPEKVSALLPKTVPNFPAVILLVSHIWPSLQSLSNYSFQTGNRKLPSPVLKRSCHILDFPHYPHGLTLFQRQPTGSGHEPGRLRRPHRAPPGGRRGSPEVRQVPPRRVQSQARPQGQVRTINTNIVEASKKVRLTV